MYFDEYRIFTNPATGSFSSSTLKRIVFPEGTTILQSGTFGSCSLERLILPSTINTIRKRVFFGPGYGGCEVMILMAVTPPTLGSDHYSPMPATIYVPDESVEAYKTADVWSYLAGNIKPLSEYTD